MTEYAPSFTFRVPEGSSAQWFLENMSKPGFQKFMDAEIAKYDKQEADAKNWRDSFKSFDQLEDGDVRMLIADFLPEGVNYIGALSGHGKTHFALSLAKCLTMGTPFLGISKYKPEKIFPVLYLAPEATSRAFKMRMRAFGVSKDETLFLCRTISEGKILRLDDPTVLAAVAAMKPIVVLDTFVRFSNAQDENSAAENRVIANNISDLIAAGAVTVIALHHSTKDFATGEITKERCLRGTGDIAATCDSVYALRRDAILYDNGNGPEEIEVHCVKARDIKNPPKPFRLGLKYKKEDGSLASYIDESGDMQIIEPGVVLANLKSKFVKLVTDDPSIPEKLVMEALSLSQYALRKLKKEVGVHRPAGPHSVWTFGPTTRPESPAATMKKQKEEATKIAEPAKTENTLFSKQDQSCAAE